jgi:hypothetical protein
MESFITIWLEFLTKLPVLLKQASKRCKLVTSRNEFALNFFDWKIENKSHKFNLVIDLCQGLQIMLLPFYLIPDRLQFPV